MTNYLVTVVCETSVSEVIRVAAAMPEEACQTAVKYAASRPFSGPLEMLLWRSSVETVQDDDYQILELPLKFASSESRIEVLERMLREVVAEAAKGVVAPDLVARVKKVLESSGLDGE